MALRKAGRHEDAIRLAREAVSLDGKSAAAQQALGFAMQSAGKLDDAVAAFTAATKIAPGDASAFWALGVAERDRKHAAEAVTALRRAAELKPAPSILEDLAMALLAGGKEAEALETLRSAAARNPRSLGLRLAQARLLAAAHKCPDARAALEGLPPDEAAVRSAAETIDKSCAAPAGKPGRGGKSGAAKTGKR